jgi:hypothetical protein
MATVFIVYTKGPDSAKGGPVPRKWLAMADTPEEAVAIVRSRAAAGADVEATGEALSEEEARRHGLTKGMARRL